MQHFTSSFRQALKYAYHGSYQHLSFNLQRNHIFSSFLAKGNCSFTLTFFVAKVQPRCTLALHTYLTNPSLQQQCDLGCNILQEGLEIRMETRCG